MVDASSLGSTASTKPSKEKGSRRAMSRLFEQPSPVPEARLIRSWVNDKFVLVVRTVEEALWESGYDTRTTVDGGDNIVTYVALSGELCGIIDLKRTLFEIATCTTGFDKRLNNALYEASKINRVVGDRVRAAKILFSTSEKDAIDQLCDMSRDLGVGFSLLKSTQ